MQSILQEKSTVKKVNANYREVWEGGDFIVSGTITLDLGDQGIWLDWHAYENGRDCGTDGYMFYNRSFKYKSAINDSVDITVELNGSQLDLEQNPIMVNDSVLLPIRAVAESMGAEVTLDRRRQKNRKRCRNTKRLKIYRLLCRGYRL